MKTLRVKFLFGARTFTGKKTSHSICVSFPPMSFSFAIVFARSVIELRKSSVSCCIVFELRKKTSVYFAEETFAFTFVCKKEAVVKNDKRKNALCQLQPINGIQELQLFSAVVKKRTFNMLLRGEVK